MKVEVIAAEGDVEEEDCFVHKLLNFILETVTYVLYGCPVDQSFVRFINGKAD